MNISFNKICISLFWLVAPLDANNVASTTRYWDCSGGACGCGYLSSPSNREAHCHSNALFVAPPGNSYGAAFYGSAAVSQTLGGGDWLAEGCGKCWKVTGTSNIGANPVATTLVLKATNYCPPANSACNGRAHFDIAAPGFDFAGASLSNSCSVVEPDELQGFTSCGNWMISSSNPAENCDCSLFMSDVLRAGCENFLSLRWNNVDVTYEEVDCPTELSRLPCWEGQWPNGLDGLCEDPGVQLTFLTPAPDGSTYPPSQQPSSSPMGNGVSGPESPDGYCSWSACMRGPEGGDWCNESEQRCISCGSGSQWCVEDQPGIDSSEPSAMPSVGPTAFPSREPSADPLASPSFVPSASPSASPSALPIIPTTDTASPVEDSASTDSPMAGPSNQSSGEEDSILFQLISNIFFCFF